MQNQRGRITRNVRAMVVGQVITWMLSLVWVIYLPRYLGPTDMGRYGIAFAIWAVVSCVISTGVPTYLIKAIARAPETASELLGIALLQRYGLFLICCLPVGLYAHFMNYSYETVVLIWLVALSMPGTHTGVVLNAIFQGLEVMQYMTMVDIVMKFLNVTFGLALMFMNYGINEIALALTVSGLIGVVVQFILLRRHVPLRVSWSNERSINMLRSSLPYFLAAIVLTLYTEIDKLILSVMLDEKAVGWYGAAATLAGTLLFIPNILTTAIFPALSRGAAQSQDDAARILRKSLDLVLVAGVPIGFGLAIVADPLVALLYGSKFSESGPVLSVYGIVLIFMYLSTVLGKYLVACDRTHAWTLMTVVCVVLAFPLNYVLIRWTHGAFHNGAIGGALRLACTEFLIVTAGLLLLPRGTLTWENANSAIRTLCAGAVMLAACWLVRDKFIAVPIVVGVITYAGMAYLLRVLPPDEVNAALGAVRGMLANLGLRLDRSRGTDTPTQQ